jgi:hypothetical protein
MDPPIHSECSGKNNPCHCQDSDPKIQSTIWPELPQLFAICHSLKETTFHIYRKPCKTVLYILIFGILESRWDFKFSSCMMTHFQNLLFSYFHHEPYFCLCYSQRPVYTSKHSCYMNMYYFSGWLDCVVLLLELITHPCPFVCQIILNLTVSL